jgi:hypothetical protein
MDVNKIIKFLNKTESKIFKKRNINFEAGLYFRLIDDTLDEIEDEILKQKLIEEYISKLDEIYKKSFIKNEQDQKICLLAPEKIEEYSILKYFNKIEEDFLTDFLTEDFLSGYSKEKTEPFKLQKINPRNILTKEKLDLTNKTKKLLLRLLSNLIKSEQVISDYSLELGIEKNGNNCIIANPKNQIVKIKK